MMGAGKSRIFRGICIAGAVLLCAAMISEVSAPRPCSLWSYMTGDVLAIAVVLGITYWPVLVLMVVLAELMAYFFARRGRHGRTL